MINSVKRILRTIRHLKLKQVRFQLFYRLRGKILKPQQLVGQMKSADTAALILQPSPVMGGSLYKADNRQFCFLNLEKTFAKEDIDWNFGEFGKLWTYNLNYFDFLSQSELSENEGLTLMNHFASSFDKLVDGLEPYPISLRGINWIKFMTRHGCADQNLKASLLRQYHILSKSLEFHLLGNHLLENAFSLLFGAYYFRNDTFYKKAERLLNEQLEEQLCADGGHFERSPMYHQIILYRLLDSLNLIRNNPWKSGGLEALLEQKAESMLAWLSEITFSNGDVPMVKDAAFDIAPSSRTLAEYGALLGVKKLPVITLGESGYRKFDTGGLECFCDVGGVAPAYQPGHAHADELNFVLYADGNPVIVDPGVSTYEATMDRFRERSTEAHNCVTIEGANSSEVWSAFRVGRRSKVYIIEDSEVCTKASHNGYSRQGVTVLRSFSTVDDKIIIEDELRCKDDVRVELNLHFHPGQKLTISDNQILTNKVSIQLSGYIDITSEKYKFADGYNRLVDAPLVKLVPTAKSKIVFKNVS
ncbi:MAG: hypothetical protein HEP71_28085 [Roseivirga sp.]|nr:hypothetical protein [Roseivirga sp.]